MKRILPSLICLALTLCLMLAVTPALAASEPLKINSFKLVNVVEYGTDDYDITVALDYTGGVQPVEECKYQIYVKASSGNWYMTWESMYENLPEMDFWIGEDGLHFLRVILTDGKDTVQADTAPFLLGVDISDPSVKNGLFQDSAGLWRYYENDVFVERTDVIFYEGGYFFVANGVLCADANGLAECNGEWYFLSNGQIQSHYTGLALYNGHWFYVQDGHFYPDTNGLVDYGGSRFLVAAGEVIRTVNGLWQDLDGQWYYLAEGQVVTYYTGLTQYDGAWFYVINGRLATEFSGTVEYDGSSFTVVNGSVLQ